MIIAYFYFAGVTVKRKKTSKSPWHNEIVDSERIAKKIKSATEKQKWDKVEILIKQMNSLMEPFVEIID